MDTLLVFRIEVERHADGTDVEDLGISTVLVFQTSFHAIPEVVVPAGAGGRSQFVGTLVEHILNGSLVFNGSFQDTSNYSNVQHIAVLGGVRNQYRRTLGTGSGSVDDIDSEAGQQGLTTVLGQHFTQRGLQFSQLGAISDRSQWGDTTTDQVVEVEFTALMGTELEVRLSRLWGWSHNWLLTDGSLLGLWVVVLVMNGHLLFSSERVLYR